MRRLVSRQLILVVGSLCLLSFIFAGLPAFSGAAEPVSQRRDTVTFEAIAPEEKPRFRVEIQGEFVSQERELDGRFVVSESNFSQGFGEFVFSTDQKRKKITDLDEKGRIELYLVKAFYSLTDRIEVHGKIGAGRIVTKLKNLKGQTIQESTGFLFPQFSSSTLPFSDTNTYRGSGNLGFAAGAGIDIVLYQSPTPNFSLILGGQWTYLRSDNVLRITDGAEIEKSHTNLFDVGIKAQLHQGPFSPYGGVKAIWLLTKYKGHYTKVEDFADVRNPANSFTKTEKKKFSFKTEPKEFPIMGLLGFDYAFTDSAGIKVEGAIGSLTQSLTAGFFYRF